MVEVYVTSFVLLFFLNIGFCFVTDREKHALLLSALDILSVLILVAIMTHANYSDLLVYERHYTFTEFDMLNSRFEGGFNWYMLICRYILRLSYVQFKFVTFLSCVLLCYLGYRKITYNFSYFVMLFMTYEIFFNGIQIRNFITISLVIFGIPYLLKGSVKGIVTYAILVLIAFSFHHAAIAYLSFAIIALPLKKLFSSKIFRAFIVGVGGLSLYILVNLTKKGTLKKMVINMAYRFINEDVGDRVVSHSGGHWGNSQIYLFALILLYFLFVLWLTKKAIIINISNYKHKLSVRKLQILKQEVVVDADIKKNFIFLNFISIFFIVLCIFSSTFYRLLRGACLLDVLYFSFVINNTSKKETRLAILIGSILLNCLWIYYDLIVPERFLEHILGFLR